MSKVPQPHHRLIAPLALALVLFYLHSPAHAGIADQMELLKRRDAISKLNRDQAEAALASFSSERSAHILSLLRKIRNNKGPLFELMGDMGQEDKNSQPILLLVEGAPDSKREYTEWVEPFNFFLEKHLDVAFHRLSRWKSIAGNTRQLEHSIQTLAVKYPHRRLWILGYCSGGIITMEAQMRLNQLAIKDSMLAQALARMDWVTAASGFNGYEAPGIIAYAGAPFVGLLNIAIGFGQAGHYIDSQLRCDHHMTTDCEYDIHACPNKNGLPQFLNPEKNADMTTPCSQGRITLHPRTTHQEILMAIFNATFGP